MRSIAHAMLWEFYRTTRWGLVSMLVAAIGLWLLPSLTRNTVPFDTNSPDFLLLYLVTSLTCIFPIAFGVSLFQSPIPRHYAFPISTATLVAWKMFLPCFAVGIVVALVFSCVNLFYASKLPFLGLALYASAITSPIYVAASQCRKQAIWNVFWGVGMMIALGFWVKLRYANSYSEVPTHLWNHITLLECATLLGTTALSYWYAVRSVDIDRCGEGFRWGWGAAMLAWIRSMFSKRESRLLPPFSSSEQSQYWYEYQQKGAAFPAITALIVSLYLGPLLIYIVATLTLGHPVFPHLTTDLLLGHIFQVLYAFGFIFSIIGLFAGCFIGIANSSTTKRHIDSLSEAINRSEHIQMGAFQASLPIVASAYSTALYRTIIRSILFTWGVWFVLFSIITMLAMVVYRNLLVAHFIETKSMGLWYFSVTLLGPWISMSNLATIWLTGRIHWVIGLILGGTGVFFVWMIGLGSIDSFRLRFTLMYASFYLLSFTILLGTIIAFVFAVRRNLFGRHYLIPVITVGVSIVAIAIMSAPFELSSIAYINILNFAAIVILPMATVPLAIDWNRHR